MLSLVLVLALVFANFSGMEVKPLLKERLFT